MSYQTGGMRLVVYEWGNPREVPIQQEHAAVINLIMPDNRTVQVVVSSSGEVELRGWGNMPAFVGNMNVLGFRAHLQAQPQTHDEHCRRLLPRDDA